MIVKSKRNYKAIMSEKIEIKIKKIHPDAVMPKFARFGDAGADLTATSRYFEEETGSLVYGTGLAFEIPYGYVGLLFPRSSISKTRFSLSNSVGVLDCGFRGEVIFKFNQVIGKLENPIYEVGERIGQIVIQKLSEVEFVEVEELSESERGTGGYGSTGK